MKRKTMRFVCLFVSKLLRSERMEKRKYYSYRHRVSQRTEYGYKCRLYIFLFVVLASLIFSVFVRSIFYGVVIFYTILHYHDGNALFSFLFSFDDLFRRKINLFPLSSNNMKKNTSHRILGWKIERKTGTVALSTWRMSIYQNGVEMSSIWEK